MEFMGIHGLHPSRRKQMNTWVPISFAIMVLIIAALLGG
jgi:hypothetical protein